MEHLTGFAREFLKAMRNLLPIVAVVAVFQLVVFRGLPEDPLQLVVGLLIVGVGIAMFLQGLDLSVFPVGKNIANQFTRRGSLGPLLAFGFAIGFAAAVAEPEIGQHGFPGHRRLAYGNQRFAALRQEDVEPRVEPDQAEPLADAERLDGVLVPRAHHAEFEHRFDPGERGFQIIGGENFPPRPFDFG